MQYPISPSRGFLTFILIGINIQINISSWKAVKTWKQMSFFKRSPVRKSLRSNSRIAGLVADFQTHQMMCKYASKSTANGAPQKIKSSAYYFNSVERIHLHLGDCKKAFFVLISIRLPGFNKWLKYTHIQSQSYEDVAQAEGKSFLVLWTPPGLNTSAENVSASGETGNDLRHLRIKWKIFFL